MATTQPIRNMEDLDALKNYYLTQKPNLRNYALICTGINTALRIGDILHLVWADVFDFDANAFRKHLVVTERKTSKKNMIVINDSMLDALTRYKNELSTVLPEHFIFFGRHPETPISRTQAYRIIKQAATALHLPDNISCHSLRKTFGYHAWVSGASPAVLMIIYNHSSFQITKRYLGIEQDDKDQIFKNLNL